jgi:hypothetical protein
LLVVLRELNDFVDTRYVIQMAPGLDHENRSAVETTIC